MKDTEIGRKTDDEVVNNSDVGGTQDQTNNDEVVNTADVEMGEGQTDTTEAIKDGYNTAGARVEDGINMVATDGVDTLNKANAAAGQASVLASNVGVGQSESGDVKKETSNCVEKCGPIASALSIAGSMLGQILAPVAGPCYWYWIHKFIVAFSILFFFVNLGILLDTFANSSVTEITTKHATSIVWPDVYLCIDALTFFHTFLCCSSSCSASVSGGCKAIGFLKLPLTGSTDGCPLGIFNDHSKGKTAATSCPYSVKVGQKVVDITNYGSINTALPMYKMTQVGANPTPVANSWTVSTFGTGLENKLPTYSPASTNSEGGSWASGNTYYPVCFHFENTAKTAALYTDPKKYIQTAFAMDPTENILTESLSTMAYLQVAGTAPYEGDASSTTGKITASEAVWPGFGTTSIGSINLDKIKDQTKGETDWTYLYQISVTSYPVSLATLHSASQTVTSVFDGSTITLPVWKPDVVIGPTSFCFSSFITREVVIRDYTVAEVWAGIGGLWAGSLLLLALFFVPTATTDKYNRPVQIFNWVFPSLKDEWMDQYEEEFPDEDNSQLEAQVQSLAQKLEELTAKVGQKPEWFQGEPQY
jgi:hypothetical protein